MKLEPTSHADDIGGSWRTLSWTLIVVLLATILMISALPWIVRRATVSLAAALARQ